MLAAEARVQELESLLGGYVDDFDNMNNDFSICADKLQQAELTIEEMKA